MWKAERGRGGGWARKCWVKSDRNGIEGKLLVAEGRLQEVVVAAGKEEKIKKKKKKSKMVTGKLAPVAFRQPLS